jgi:hypothetical protein
MSDLEKAVAKVLGDRTNTGGGYGNKKKRSPNNRCKFYCDTHGCNFTHNSDKCKAKETGHSDTATFSNPTLVSTRNKDIYTGPGCPPCNVQQE